MQHMMPMMWVFILISFFIILFIILSLIYFFYLPSLSTNNFKKNKSNWSWKW